MQRRLELIPEAEVQGQLRGDLPVVLHEDAPRTRLLDVIRLPGDAAGIRQAEQQLGDRLPDAARSAGRVVQRTAGPGGAEGELAGLLVALELIGFLVHAVLEARADGMRARRFGQGRRDGVVVDRAVLVGVPVADVAGQVDAREPHLVLRDLADVLLREAQRSQIEADRALGLVRSRG